MVAIQVEFEVRLSGEAYLRGEDTVVDVLRKGNIQLIIPILQRYRTYELDDDDSGRYNYSEWVELETPIDLMYLHLCL